MEAAYAELVGSGLSQLAVVAVALAADVEGRQQPSVVGSEFVAVEPSSVAAAVGCSQTPAAAG